jgi:hypothetical protein
MVDDGADSSKLSMDVQEKWGPFNLMLWVSSLTVQ